MKKNFKKNLSFTLPFITAFMFFVSGNVSASPVFSDLDEVPWAKDEILYLYEHE